MPVLNRVPGLRLGAQEIAKSYYGGHLMWPPGGVAPTVNPVEFVASTGAAGTVAATVSIPVPAGVQPGDLLVCNYSLNTSGKITDMDGWTLLYGTNPVVGGDRKTTVLYTVAPDPVPASFTFGTDGNGLNYHVLVSAYRGQTAYVPIIHAPEAKSYGSSHATGTLEAGAGSMAYALWRTRKVQTWSPDAALTVLASGTLGGNIEMLVGYEGDLAAGNVSYTTTKSGADSEDLVSAVLCLIRPPRAGEEEQYWARARADAWDEASLTQRLGYVFTVGAAPIKVNRLRMYRSGATALTENVSIHRVSDGALIAAANVTGQTPASAPSHDEAVISEVTLEAGVAYTVSAHAGGSVRFVPRNPGPVAFDPRITTGLYVYGTSGAMPDISTGNAYVAPDFGYIAP